MMTYPTQYTGGMTLSVSGTCDPGYFGDYDGQVYRTGSGYTLTGSYDDDAKRPEEEPEEDVKRPFLDRLIDEHEDRCGGAIARLKKEF